MRLNIENKMKCSCSNTVTKLHEIIEEQRLLIEQQQKQINCLAAQIAKSDFSCAPGKQISPLNGVLIPVKMKSDPVSSSSSSVSASSSLYPASAASSSSSTLVHVPPVPCQSVTFIRHQLPFAVAVTSNFIPPPPSPTSSTNSSTSNSNASSNSNSSSSSSSSSLSSSLSSSETEPKPKPNAVARKCKFFFC